MSRFLAVLLAALACAFIYLVATGIALPQAATARATFVVASVALVLSGAAVAVAVVTAARMRAQRIRLQNLARSVDAALHDFAARKDEGGAMRIPGVAAGPIATAQDAARQPADADRRPIEIAPAKPPVTAQRMERGPVAPAASQQPAAAGMSLRLRPLLSTATGNVAGFDVLPGPQGGEDGAVENPAARERGSVLDTIEASSRPGFAGERTPLHVAISQALLADRAELAVVVGALRRLNGTARSIVLTLPTELMEKPAQHAAALARLAASGPRLAAEGWPGSERDVEALWRSGVSFLRLPAAKLLAHEVFDARKTASLIRMLAASGMATIATGVRSEAEVAELDGLGVVLTTPATPPEPARPESGNGAGAGEIAHI